MISDNFDRAFEYTLRNEGGVSTHAADSGGATKYGVTKATLAGWRERPVTEADVVALTRDEAKSIYKAWYWDALKLDDVERLIVATVLFDSAVLFGVPLVAVRAQKVLIMAGSPLVIDGLIGPKSLAALNALDEKVFVLEFQAELRARINEIIRVSPKNEVFRKGWADRVDRFTTLIA